MNGAPQPVAHYRAEYAAVEARLPGHGVPWVREARETAMARFSTLGFPGPRDEDWKYTRLTALQKQAFRAQGETCIGLDADDIAPFEIQALDCHRLVFLNGRYAPQLSSPRREVPDGVTLGSLAEVLDDGASAVQPHLGRLADGSSQGFTALNAAFMEGGGYLHLAKNTQAPRPIHLIFVSTIQSETFCQPRNLIVVEAGAEASVIETYVPLGGTGYFTNAVTEAVVGENAGLRHYKVQREDQQAFHIARMEVLQRRDSRFESHSFSLGGRLVRNDINVRLDDEGAECTLNGLYVAASRQHMDYHTRIDHAKPNGTSAELYKGILSGRARGVFNGRVYVHPDAQMTDARQSNANLLLSRDAEVDTKPQLEIYADDVKCAHGATVGQLDEDMIFYLRARGLEHEAAQGLLTYGFAGEVIDQVGLEPLRGQLRDLLLDRLPGGDDIRGMLS